MRERFSVTEYALASPVLDSLFAMMDKHPRFRRGRIECFSRGTHGTFRVEYDDLPNVYALCAQHELDNTGIVEFDNDVTNIFVPYGICDCEGEEGCISRSLTERLANFDEQLVLIRQVLNLVLSRHIERGELISYGCNICGCQNPGSCDSENDLTPAGSPAPPVPPYP